jgi:short-subunit dehydrogenase
MKNVALITGASSGIGKELAIIHAEKKGDMVLIARSADKLNALKIELEQKFGIKVYVIVKDLSQREAVQEIYEELQQKGIAVEYLINNAGFGGLGLFAERDWKSDEEMIHLNIRALTGLSRIFLPDMLKRNSGRILNVSSTASLMPGPLQAVYFASKAFVTSFSNALAEELSDTNVTVTALLPGATATEFGAVSGMDKTEMFKKTFPAREVAEDGYNAMMKGTLNKITGMSFFQKLTMSLIPFIPTKIILGMVKKLQKVK